VSVLDGADLNSSEKKPVMKNLLFYYRIYCYSQTWFIQKALGYIVIAVMKETTSSQQNQIDLSI
jgi:hypothetical protein